MLTSCGNCNGCLPSLVTTRTDIKHSDLPTVITTALHIITTALHLLLYMSSQALHFLLYMFSQLPYTYCSTCFHNCPSFYALHVFTIALHLLLHIFSQLPYTFRSSCVNNCLRDKNILLIQKQQNKD